VHITQLPVPLKKHLNDSDFIPAFLASSYADTRTCRPRLKFRYENNFVIAINCTVEFEPYLPPRPRPPPDEYRSFAAAPCHNRHRRTDRHRR